LVEAGRVERISLISLILFISHASISFKVSNPQTHLPQTHKPTNPSLTLPSLPSISLKPKPIEAEERTKERENQTNQLLLLNSNLQQAGEDSA
jgi:hypothetical protein